MKLPIFEIFIQDTDAVELAIVDEPAIEEDFMYFNSEEVKMEFNDDKMIIKGPALVPNRKIYRNDALGQRYVFMSEETVVKFAEILMNKQTNRFNVSHTDTKLKANIIESYFAQEPNEFNVPKGSWIVSLKVNDKEIWNKIKKGEFKGFSVEGLFSNELTEFNKINNKQEQMKELKEKLAAAINSILFNEETAPEVEAPEIVEEVEKVEEFKTDEFKSALSEQLEAFKVSLLADIDAKIGSVKDEMKKVNERVEEFSKQPLTESVVVETVANPSAVKSSNKATEYFKN